MMLLTETCRLYQFNFQTLGDANNVTGPVTLLKTNVPCNLQRGATLDPQDVAYALGVDTRLTAYAYFHTDAAPFLLNRYVLLDQENRPWIIRNVPSVRKRFAATAHIKCLLLQLQSRPNGLPA